MRQHMCKCLVCPASASQPPLPYLALIDSKFSRMERSASERVWITANYGVNKQKEITHYPTTCTGRTRNALLNLPVLYRGFLLQWPVSCGTAVVVRQTIQLFSIIPARSCQRKRSDTKCSVRILGFLISKLGH